MNVGVRLTFIPPQFWMPLAEAAETLGFESIWVTDHLVLPVHMTGSPLNPDDPSPIGSDVHVHDPFVSLAAMAARTPRSGLARASTTSAYGIPLPRPARSPPSTQSLGGRTLLGVGAGWLRGEWSAAGLDFDSRGGRTDETIEICRRLWTEKTIEHHGDTSTSTLCSLSRNRSAEFPRFLSAATVAQPCVAPLGSGTPGFR